MENMLTSSKVYQEPSGTLTSRLASDLRNRCRPAFVGPFGCCCTSLPSWRTLATACNVGVMSTTMSFSSMLLNQHNVPTCLDVVRGRSMEVDLMIFSVM